MPSNRKSKSHVSPHTVSEHSKTAPGPSKSAPGRSKDAPEQRNAATEHSNAATKQRNAATKHPNAAVAHSTQQASSSQGVATYRGEKPAVPLVYRVLVRQEHGKSGPITGYIVPRANDNAARSDSCPTPCRLDVAHFRDAWVVDYSEASLTSGDCFATVESYLRNSKEPESRRPKWVIFRYEKESVLKGVVNMFTGKGGQTLAENKFPGCFVDQWSPNLPRALNYLILSPAASRRLAVGKDSPPPAGITISATESSVRDALNSFLAADATNRSTLFPTCRDALQGYCDASLLNTISQKATPANAPWMIELCLAAEMPGDRSVKGQATADTIFGRTLQGAAVDLSAVAAFASSGQSLRFSGYLNNRLTTVGSDSPHLSTLLVIWAMEGREAVTRTCTSHRHRFSSTDVRDFIRRRGECVTDRSAPFWLSVLPFTNFGSFDDVVAVVTALPPDVLSSSDAVSLFLPEAMRRILPPPLREVDKRVTTVSTLPPAVKGVVWPWLETSVRRATSSELVAWMQQPNSTAPQFSALLPEVIAAQCQKVSKSQKSLVPREFVELMKLISTAVDRGVLEQDGAQRLAKPFLMQGVRPEDLAELIGTLASHASRWPFGPQDLLDSVEPLTSSVQSDTEAAQTLDGLFTDGRLTVPQLQRAQRSFLGQIIESLCSLLRPATAVRGVASALTKANGRTMELGTLLANAASEHFTITARATCKVDLLNDMTAHARESALSVCTALAIDSDARWAKQLPTINASSTTVAEVQRLSAAKDPAGDFGFRAVYSLRSEVCAEATTLVERLQQVVQRAEQQRDVISFFPPATATELSEQCNLQQLQNVFSASTSDVVSDVFALDERNSAVMEALRRETVAFIDHVVKAQSTAKRESVLVKRLMSQSLARYDAVTRANCAAFVQEAVQKTVAALKDLLGPAPTVSVCRMCFQWLQDTHTPVSAELKALPLAYLHESRAVGAAANTAASEEKRLLNLEKTMTEDSQLFAAAQSLRGCAANLASRGFTSFAAHSNTLSHLEALAEASQNETVSVQKRHEQCTRARETLLGKRGTSDEQVAFVLVLAALPDAESLIEFFATRPAFVSSSGYSAGLDSRLSRLLSQVTGHYNELLESFKEVGHLVAVLVANRSVSTLPELMAAVLEGVGVARALTTVEADKVTPEVVTTLKLVTRNMHFIQPFLDSQGMDAESLAMFEHAQVAKGYYVQLDCRTKATSLTYAIGDMDVTVDGERLNDSLLRFNFVAESDRRKGGQTAAEIDKLLLLVDAVGHSAEAISQLHALEHPHFLLPLAAVAVGKMPSTDCKAVTQADLDDCEATLAQWKETIGATVSEFGLLHVLDHHAKLQLVHGLQTSNANLSLALLLPLFAPGTARLSLLEKMLRTLHSKLPKGRDNAQRVWVEELNDTIKLISQYKRSGAGTVDASRHWIVTNLRGECTLFNCFTNPVATVLAFLNTIFPCGDDSFSPLQVLWCSTDVGETHLDCFLRCASSFPNIPFVLVYCDRLPRRIQQHLRDHLMHYRHSMPNVVLIATTETTLHEMADLPQATPPAGPAGQDTPKPTMKMECFRGPAGCGKTYQLRKRLAELCAASPTSTVHCTVSVTEGFTAAAAASTLYRAIASSPVPLSTVVIAVHLSLGGYQKKKHADWMEVFRQVNVFLYSLVRLHCVASNATGEYVSFQPNWNSSVLVELPMDDFVPKQDVLDYFPVLSSLDAVVHNCRDCTFDLDADAELVAKYLKAYDDGTIDTLATLGRVPTDILVFLDISGSMGSQLGGAPNSTRLTVCQSAVGELVDLFGELDQCAVVAFDHDSADTGLAACKDDHVQAMKAFIGSQQARGGTKLWTALNHHTRTFPSSRAAEQRRQWWFIFSDGDSLEDDAADVEAFLKSAEGENIGVMFLAAGISAEARNRVSSICIRDDTRDKIIEVGDSVHAYKEAFEEAGRLISVNELVLNSAAGITPDEVRSVIFKHMRPGDHRTWSRIHMRQWLRYMRRRCTILQASETFDSNADMPQYGSTTMRMMLAEVQHAMAKTHAEWEGQLHEHMVYRTRTIKNAVGEDVQDCQWSIIAANQDRDKTWPQRAAALNALHMCVPTPEDCQDPDVLASYLAYAVGAQLNNAESRQSSDGRTFDFEIGSLPLLAERKFVLTLDFLMKMLSIHERIECGVPCIMMGETGVSKTALTNMLFALKNTFQRGPLVTCMRAHKLPMERVAAAAEHLGVSMPASTSLQEACRAVAGNCPTLSALLMKELQQNPSLDVLEKFTIEDLQSISATHDLDKTSSLLEWLAADADEGESQSGRRDAYGWCFRSVCLDAAMTPASVCQIFEDVTRRAARLAALGDAFPLFVHHQQAKLCVFLDEFNTSSCLGLLKEVIQDHSIHGEQLPPSIVVVAACNPLREKLPLHTGHRGAEQGREWVQGHYNVNPLPVSLSEAVWDYGGLTLPQEKELIERRTEQEFPKLSKKARQTLSLWIYEAHAKTRTLAENHVRDVLNADGRRCSEEDAKARASSALSIRDILRVFTMCDFLVHLDANISAVVFDSRKSSSDDARLSAAIVLAITIVYYLRLSGGGALGGGGGSNQRQEFVDHMRAILGQDVDAILVLIIGRLSKQTTLRRGVVATRGLMENVFMVLMTVLSKVPLMIIGPPGSSKTLAVNTIIENCRDRATAKSFYASVGEIVSVHYQCSRRSTSREIEAVFEQAIERQQRADHLQSMQQYFVFMDEAGLPEEERESLKVLHYYLEGHVSRDAQVGFVAISNHILDAAKSNRCNVLLRGVQDDGDIVQLTEACLSPEGARMAMDPSITARTVDELLTSLSSVFRCLQLGVPHPVTSMPAPATTDLFGLRDFMHLHKLLGRLAEGGNRRLDARALTKAVARNFSGLPSQAALRVLQYFLAGLVRDVPQVPLNQAELLLESLTERMDRDELPAARYAAILTTTTDDGVMRLLRRAVSAPHAQDEKRQTVFLCSDVLSDNALFADVNVVNHVCWAMEQGYTAVLSGAERVHEALYDLLNQHFMLFVDSSKTACKTTLLTNVAIGAQSSRRTVSSSFRFMLCFSPSDLHSAPAPLLDRLEKFHVSMADVIDYCVRHELSPGAADVLAPLVGPLRRHMNDIVEWLPNPSFCGLVPLESVDSAVACVLQQWRSEEDLRAAVQRAAGDNSLPLSAASPATDNAQVTLLLAAQRKVARQLVQMAIPEKLLSACANDSGTHPLTELFFELVAQRELRLFTSERKQLVITCCDIASALERWQPAHATIDIHQIHRSSSLEKELAERLREAPVVVVQADLRMESHTVLNYIRATVDTALGDTSVSGPRVVVVAQMHAVQLRSQSAYDVTFSPDWNVQHIDHLDDKVSLPWLTLAYKSVSQATADEALRQCVDLALSDVAATVSFVVEQLRSDGTVAVQSPSHFSVQKLRDMLTHDHEGRALVTCITRRIKQMFASNYVGDAADAQTVEQRAVCQQIRHVVSQQAQLVRYDTLKATVAEQLHNPIVCCIVEVLKQLLLYSEQNPHLARVDPALATGLRQMVYGALTVMPPLVLQRVQGPLAPCEIQLPASVSFPFFSHVFPFLASLSKETKKSMEAAEEDAEEDADEEDEDAFLSVLQSRITDDQSQPADGAWVAAYVMQHVWNVTDVNIVALYVQQVVAKTFPQITPQGRLFVAATLNQQIEDCEHPIPRLHCVLCADPDGLVQVTRAADALVPLCGREGKSLSQVLGDTVEDVDALVSKTLDYVLGIVTSNTLSTHDAWQRWVSVTQRLYLEDWEENDSFKKSVTAILTLRRLFFAMTTDTESASRAQLTFMQEAVKIVAPSRAMCDAQRDTFRTLCSTLTPAPRALHYVRHFISSKDDALWALGAVQAAKSTKDVHDTRFLIHTCLAAYSAVQPLTAFDSFTSWIVCLSADKDLESSLARFGIHAYAAFTPTWSAHADGGEPVGMALFHVLQWWMCQWDSLRDVHDQLQTLETLTTRADGHLQLPRLVSVAAAVVTRRLLQTIVCSVEDGSGSALLENVALQAWLGTYVLPHDTWELVVAAAIEHQACGGAAAELVAAGGANESASDEAQPLCALLHRASQRIAPSRGLVLEPHRGTSQLCQTEAQAVELLSLLWVVPAGWDVYVYLHKETYGAANVNWSQSVSDFLRFSPVHLRTWQILCALARVLPWLPLPELAPASTLQDVVSVKQLDGSDISNALYDTLWVVLDAYAGILRSCPGAGDQAPRATLTTTVGDAGLPDTLDFTAHLGVTLNEDGRMPDWVPNMSDDEVLSVLLRHRVYLSTCSQTALALTPALYLQHVAKPSSDEQQRLRRAVESAQSQLRPVVAARGVRVDKALYPILCTRVKDAHSESAGGAVAVVCSPESLRDVFHSLNYQGVALMLERFTSLMAQVDQHNLWNTSIRSALGACGNGEEDALMQALASLGRTGDKDFDALLSASAKQLPSVVRHLKIQLAIGAYQFCDYAKCVKAVLPTLTLQTIRTEMRRAGDKEVRELERLVVQRESSIVHEAARAGPTTLIGVLFQEFRSREHAEKLFPTAALLDRVLSSEGDSFALLCHHYVAFRLLLAQVRKELTAQHTTGDPSTWTWLLDASQAAVPVAAAESEVTAVVERPPPPPAVASPKAAAKTSTRGLFGGKKRPAAKKGVERADLVELESMVHSLNASLGLDEAKDVTDLLTMLQSLGRHTRAELLCARNVLTDALRVFDACCKADQKDEIPDVIRAVVDGATHAPAAVVPAPVRAAAVRYEEGPVPLPAPDVPPLASTRAHTPGAGAGVQDTQTRMLERQLVRTSCFVSVSASQLSHGAYAQLPAGQTAAADALLRRLDEEFEQTRKDFKTAWHIDIATVPMDGTIDVSQLPLLSQVLTMLAPTQDKGRKRALATDGVTGAVAATREALKKGDARVALIMALLESSATRLCDFAQDATEYLNTYLSGGKLHPAAWLVAARLVPHTGLAARASNAFVHRCRGCDWLVHFMSKEEKIRCFAPAAGARCVSIDPALPKEALAQTGQKSTKGEWELLKERYMEEGDCDAMDELMTLIGLETVKRGILDVYIAALRDRDRGELGVLPVTYNFVLQGNPGTGKTVVARLMGKILHHAGVRKADTFVGTTGEELVRMGAAAAAQLIDSAKDGVLFIDEAYGLEPGSSAEGKAITLQLLDVAENRRDSLSIIFAGYPDDLQTKLFDFNDGFTSRFPFVFTFDDYVASELEAIFSLYSTKSRCDAPESVVRLVGRRVERGRGRKGFGNARTVRAVFEQAHGRMKVRLPMDAPAQLTAEDILGPRPSRESPPTLKAALKELEALTGLVRVKERLYQLIDLASENYQRQLDGEAQRDVVLNTVFLGNPGTGKTTVARLYGRIMGACGLLSKGGDVLVKGSDMIGQHVGETQTKVTKLLKRCEGKVLIIDEAYALHKGSSAGYGAEAIDTLVGNVHGAPGEDISVVLLGYEKDMQDMMDKANPGLASRFNLQNAFYFDDYTDEELHTIVQRLAGKKGIQFAPGVRDAMVQHLSLQRASRTFGNARTAEAFLTDSMHAMAQRDRTAKTLTLADLGLERGAPDMSAVFKPLDSLYRVDKIRAHLERLCARLTQLRQSNKPLHSLVKNYIFLGNPGTGKTTVGRVFASILYELGCIERPHVEVHSAQNLQADRVGQTAGRVQDAMNAARGGVLLLDEAYTLAGGRGTFASEVVDELTTLMTSDAHKGHTVVILAGYTDQMNRMLRAVNPGFAGRFTERLEFEDWTPADCIAFICDSLKKEEHTIEDAAARALQACLEKICQRPDWANARYCLDTLEWLEEERAVRLYQSPQGGNVGDGGDAASQQYTLSDANGVCAKWYRMQPVAPREKRHPTNDHRGPATFAFADDTQMDLSPSVMEVLEESAEENEAEKPAEKEAAKKQNGDDEDPIFAALLVACQEAGYDASHERRQELVAILETVLAQSGVGLPDTIVERIKSQVPGKPWPAIMKALLPQIPIVLLGMRNAVAAEEAYREEMRRLAAEERQRKEQELAAKQEKLRHIGLCPMGFAWHREGDMWRCNGGAHLVRDVDL